MPRELPDAFDHVAGADFHPHQPPTERREHYGKPVILLIDEYDVPLAKASANGFYKDMLDVMKGLLQVMKDNPSLQHAVVTGCLRIAKESIFSGTNNFTSDTITDTRSFIEHSGSAITQKFEELLAGKHIIQNVAEYMTYDYIHSSEENLWSILYLTGYLTRVREENLSGRVPSEGEFALKIPNAEIQEIFENTVITWFSDTAKTLNRQKLFTAVWNRDIETLENEMTKLLRKTMPNTVRIIGRAMKRTAYVAISYPFLLLIM